MSLLDDDDDRATTVPIYIRAALELAGAISGTLPLYCMLAISARWNSPVSKYSILRSLANSAAC